MLDCCDFNVSLSKHQEVRLPRSKVDACHGVLCQCYLPKVSLQIESARFSRLFRHLTSVRRRTTMPISSVHDAAGACFTEASVRWDIGFSVTLGYRLLMLVV